MQYAMIIVFGQSVAEPACGSVNAKAVCMRYEMIQARKVVAKAAETQQELGDISFTLVGG